MHMQKGSMQNMHRPSITAVMGDEESLIPDRIKNSTGGCFSRWLPGLFAAEKEYRMRDNAMEGQEVPPIH